MLTCTLGWLIGSTALMVLFAWQAMPEHEPELGAYHDPAAAAVPIVALMGWIMGGIGGASVALGVARRDDVGPTVAILAVVTAIAGLPLAVLTAFLAAFGGAAALLPIAAVYGVSVPPVARLMANARGQDRLRSLPPPPAPAWPAG